METADRVSARKLRGGYYTPPGLVRFCLERLHALLGTRDSLDLLEPSAGDGAFVRECSEASAFRAARWTCIEADRGEARKCRRTISEAGLRGSVAESSFFSWAVTASAAGARFDGVVGNPPFIRYQFVSPRDRRSAERLASEAGIEPSGVSNAWILFSIVALGLLRPGGAFALVLPSEALGTVAAGAYRALVVRAFEDVRVDLFPRETFPEILQDVLVVSGRKATEIASARRVEFVDHDAPIPTPWTREVSATTEPWTRCLLSSSEWAAFESASNLPGVKRLGEVARMTVSVVTGANGYFTVDDDTANEFSLSEWARPLLCRTSDCDGLVVTKRDVRSARERGSRVWLLDFSERRASPRTAGVRRYLALGKRLGIPRRYKCEIREPWYRVPGIVAGRLLMTKRSHRHHRLLSNHAGVITTDTIYRGEVLQSASLTPRDLVAAFHGSITLLSAELEGRTYGGGVLELVPSEIGRLLVPALRVGDAIEALDSLSRETNGQRDREDRVSRATDALLTRELPGYEALVDELTSARLRLVARRLRG